MVKTVQSQNLKSGMVVEDWDITGSRVVKSVVIVPRLGMKYNRVVATFEDGTTKKWLEGSRVNIQ